MKKPEFKIEVKRGIAPTLNLSKGAYYDVYLYKDGKIMLRNVIPCTPSREHIVRVGDLVMKLEAFTKYYTEDND